MREVILFLLVILPAGALAQDGPMAKLIAPGKSVGPINAVSTEAGLEGLLPAGQVRRTLIYVGEGFMLCGSEVFAGTPDAVFVQWASGPAEYDGAETREEVLLERCRDEPPMERPERVMIRQQPGGEALQWRTAEGIRVGMTFAALARITGTPLAASVCPCDYGGIVFPGQEGLDPGLAFWIDFPADVEVRLGEHIDPANLYEFVSSDTPQDMEAEFLVTRIDVEIGSP